MIRGILSFGKSAAVRAGAAVMLMSLLFYISSLLISAISWDEPIPAVGTGDYEGRTVILDAGHGGEDSGAVGVNGVPEKELNLAVTTALAAMLRSAGVTVIETRTEDRLLYRPAENIKGQKKMYDLRNRLAVAEENPDALFISVHMNTFTDAKYSGFQIYYSENRESIRILAGELQDIVKKYLQPENNRKIKAAGDNIYLLDRAKENPSILIECGFISNPAECEKLSSEDYRKQLSFILFCGIMNYMTENKTSP